MKPRALIVVENAPYALDSRVRHESQALLHAGWDVAVICPRTSHVTQDGVGAEPRIVEFPTAPGIAGAAGYLIEYAWSVAWIVALVARAARSGVDVVQVCNPPDVLFVAGLLPRTLGGCALVYDQHDLVPELFAAKFGRYAAVDWGLRLFERLSYGFADIVISPNESYRETALGRGRRLSRDVVVVRNGPDLAGQGDQSVSAPPGGSALVGYVGMIGGQDGVDMLVRAAHSIVADRGRQDVRFLVIGDGPALPGVRALARELGVEGSFEFAGMLRGELMYDELRRADICVVPDPKSAYTDKSTMIKVMEYMALGMPIVQFDLLEGRRSAGEASLYAAGNDPRDLADCILELADDPDRRARMGRVGLERIDGGFSWSHQVPSLLRAYQAALEVARARKGGRARARSLVAMLRPILLAAGSRPRSNARR